MKIGKRDYHFKNAVINGKKQHFKIKSLYSQKGLRHILMGVKDRDFVQFEVDNDILFINITKIEGNKVSESRADWRYEFYE